MPHEDTHKSDRLTVDLINVSLYNWRCSFLSRKGTKVWNKQQKGLDLFHYNCRNGGAVSSLRTERSFEQNSQIWTLNMF